MLNISPNSIQHNIDQKSLGSFSKVNLPESNFMFTRFLLGSLGIFLVFLFLPWTQNVQSKGTVTPLRPEHRPQTIHSTIAGRIEKWYVQEGQPVKKGDTIVYLSEIKADYFDPDLIPRTAQQVSAKQGAIVSYDSKMSALDNQIQSLEKELTLKQDQLANKVRQNELKIISDSIELERAKVDLEIAERQALRIKGLYDQGLESLTKYEQKKLKVQETTAKRVSTENKFLESKNELINAQIALNNIVNEYRQKIAKASSDRFSAESDKFQSEAEVSKLRIESSNYEKRSQFYYITAPIDAIVAKALKPGIGETIKEGDPIVSIVSASYELAVELYVRPMDLPLIQMGSEVRFIFDGWPALFISGWPGFSFGTYRGRVVAIDNIISDNKKYRILVAADNSFKEWPEALRPGSGAQGIALLNNVALWYEIWRNLNGFPPDYYEGSEELPKLSAPIKSVPK